MSFLPSNADGDVYLHHTSKTNKSGGKKSGHRRKSEERVEFTELTVCLQNASRSVMAGKCHEHVEKPSAQLKVPSEGEEDDVLTLCGPTEPHSFDWKQRDILSITDTALQVGGGGGGLG